MTPVATLASLVTSPKPRLGVVERLRAVAEAGEVPVGTTHQWKTGAFTKMAPGVWVPKTSPSSGGSSKPAALPWTPKPKPKPFTFAKGKPEEITGTITAPSFPKPLPTGVTWIEKAEGLPASTYEAYYPGGSPTPERRELRNLIVETRLAKVKPTPEGKKPVAVLMMGLSASGKSSIAQGLVGDGSEFVMVDPDAIKEDLPEYQEAIDQHARNAAFLVHKESAKIADRLKKEAVKSRRSLVVDGTGRDGYAYEETIGHLKKAGYDIHLFMAACDTETAVQRAEERAGQTGRWVPPDLIRAMPAAVHPNFLRIAKLVPNAALYNTNGFPPKKLWTKEGGRETTHDPEDYETFRSSAGVTTEGVASLVARLLMETKKDPKAPLSLLDRAWLALNVKPTRAKARFTKEQGLLMPPPDDGALKPRK